MANYFGRHELTKKRLPKTTNAMPPNIIAAESRKRNDMDSEINMTPPSAAIKGTDSCETAARVVDKPRNAKYQIV